MSVSPTFRSFALDQLSRVLADVRGRAMFGGVGIYSGESFFALIDDDTLYLKVDDSNRGDFEVLGMGPFRPAGSDGEGMQYYELPADLLEDADTLRPWAEKALAAARRGKTGRAARAVSRRRGRAR